MHFTMEPSRTEISAIMSLHSTRFLSKSIESQRRLIRRLSSTLKEDKYAVSYPPCYYEYDVIYLSLKTITYESTQSYNRYSERMTSYQKVGKLVFYLQTISIKITNHMYNTVSMLFDSLFSLIKYQMYNIYRAALRLHNKISESDTFLPASRNCSVYNPTVVVMTT